MRIISNKRIIIKIVNKHYKIVSLSADHIATKLILVEPNQKSLSYFFEVKRTKKNLLLNRPILGSLHISCWAFIFNGLRRKL